MNHELRIFYEIQKLVRDVVKNWLVLQKFGGNSVDVESLARHFTARVDVSMKNFSGFNFAKHFDAGDLDDSVAVARIEAGGFNVETDFAHYS